MNAIFVCFVYSAALPFLYVTTFLTILFLYFIDKQFLLTNLYKKPVIFDLALTEVVRKVLWLALAVHIAFSVYIYGSSNLFYEAQNLAELDMV